MIAVWMLYCFGISAAFCLGGYALERALHYAGRPTRWAWVLALIASYLVPVVAWLRPDAFATFTVPISVVSESTASSSTVITTASTSFDQPPTRAFSLGDLDVPLGWGWGIASFAMLLVLATAAARLMALRRRWRQRVVDGRQVLISTDIGPAVVGVLAPRVVLPEWALELSESERDLMLAHEEQHVRAADPALLVAALLAAFLAPWNLALWWQWRRLRLAVEMDCDARVLAPGRSAPAYGELLLRVASHRRGQPLGVAAFGEPISFVESRIRRMLAGLPRWRWAGIAVGLLIATGAIIGACEAPRPVGPVSEAGESVASSRVTWAGIVSVETLPGDRTRVEQAPAVLAAPTMAYPDLPRLAGIQGRVVVQALIETSGRADPNSVTVLDSPHPALAQVAKNAVLRSLFRPAEADGQAVAAVVRITYAFANELSKAEAAPDLTDRLAVLRDRQLRTSIERYARKWYPAIVEPNGPPMDAFLVHDSHLRVYRGALTTLYYLGNARPSSATPQDTAVTPEMRQYLSEHSADILQHQGELVGRLARRYHPEMFGQTGSQISIALVLDSRGNVLAHAARAGEARTPDGLYTTGENCLDVLWRLIPQYAKAKWSQSGCAGDTQPNVIVYWARLLQP